MSKQISTIDEVRNSLDLMTDQFKRALPPHIDPKKFIRVAMTAIQMSPKLLELDRRSLYGELIKCAQDGLLPDGAEASVIPYGDKARYQPQIKGITKKARNSGEISSLDAQVVYESDQYESWTDEKGPHFKHVKARGSRGNPILTYAYAITKDGGFYFEEIDEDQMSAIEACSKGKDGPWKGSFRDEMKRKSALKRLAKYRLPSSTDIDMLLNRDNDLYEMPSEQTPQATEAQSDEPKTVSKPRSKTKPNKLSETLSAMEPPRDINEPPFDPNEEVPL